MSYRTDKLVIDGHTDTHTHAGNDNTRKPKLASGKNQTRKIEVLWFLVCYLTILKVVSDATSWLV